MSITFSSLLNISFHDIPYSLFIYHYLYISTYIYTWHSSMLVNLVFSQKWLYSPHAPSHITGRCWAKRCIYDDDPYVVMPRMLILITSHILYHITVSADQDAARSIDHLPQTGEAPRKEYKAAISGWYLKHTCRWRCFVDFFSLFCRWRITIIAFARQWGETSLLSHKDLFLTLDENLTICVFFLRPNHNLCFCLKF